MHDLHSHIHVAPKQSDAARQVADMTTVVLIFLLYISIALAAWEQHVSKAKHWLWTGVPERGGTEKEQACPPWMFYNETSGACECSDIPYRAVLCDPTIPRTSILDCYCMTYNSEQNETELGRCVYGCGHKTDTVYYELPNKTQADLNEYSCGKANRTSTLCGECKPGLSPLVYSYDLTCMNCTGMTYNWIKYIAVAYIPLTAFFFLVVLFRFSGTSPLIRAFISICQGLVSPVSIRAYLSGVGTKPYIKTAVKILGSIYGIWNLDFFRTLIPPICLEITPLQALALDYAVAFYPLVLVAVVYVLISLHSRNVRIVVWAWKPISKVCRSRKKKWDLEGSIARAFATFFILSFLKILNVTTDLLVFTEMYTLSDNEKSYDIKRVLYYDASVAYFGEEHLFYGILAVVIGFVMVVFPMMFLIIYPMRWFQRCLNRFHFQRQSIDIFINCFQGYYKDGTNGTKDHRWYSVSFFLLQFGIFITFTLSRSIYCFALGALLIVIMLFIALAVQPYKEQFKTYSKVDGFLLLILASLYIMTLGADEADIKAPYFSTGSYTILALLGCIPIFYLIFLCFWWLFVKKNLKNWCVRIIQSCHQRAREATDDVEEFPDRLEHPTNYVNSPLIPALGNSSQHQDRDTGRYGTIQP